MDTAPSSARDIPVSPREREAQLAALQARVLACRACHEAGFIAEAHPIRHAWTPRQRTMIVGQAPGLQTELKQFHFAGPGGKLLGQWLTAAGYDPEHWRDACYITSMTRCFPGKNPRGSGDRKPGPAELALCRPYLDDELRLVQPRLILAVGGMAIDFFLGRSSLDRVVGTLAMAHGRAILPLPHPSPVSRWLNDPAHRLLLDRAIGLLGSARRDLDL
jgi:uracil-DNA glycosylase